MKTSLYLFTGFLESGKTTTIKYMLQNGSLGTEERKTLLILCEEGDEEFPQDLLAKFDIHLEVISRQEQYTAAYLEGLLENHKCTDVIVEYNGFWPSARVYLELPPGWYVKEKYFCADASTIAAYGVNLKVETDDKIQYSSYSAFNRVTPSMDVSVLRGLCRKNSFRTRVFYQYTDGSICEDLEYDSPPYNMEAEIVDIQDHWVGCFMLDLARRPGFYRKNAVRFRGYFKRKGELLLFGRDVTLARREDATFWGIPCKLEGQFVGDLSDVQWWTLTATIESNEHEERGGLYLCVLAYESSLEPRQPIVVVK